MKLFATAVDVVAVLVALMDVAAVGVAGDLGRTGEAVVAGGCEAGADENDANVDEVADGVALAVHVAAEPAAAVVAGVRQTAGKMTVVGKLSGSLDSQNPSDCQIRKGRLLATTILGVVCAG